MTYFFLSQSFVFLVLVKSSSIAKVHLMTGVFFMKLRLPSITHDARRCRSDVEHMSIESDFVVQN